MVMIATGNNTNHDDNNDNHIHHNNHSNGSITYDNNTDVSNANTNTSNKYYYLARGEADVFFNIYHLCCNVYY